MPGPDNASAATTRPVRLQRLLTYLEHDPQNLALRKDAIREAFGAGQWDTARELLEAGLRANPAEPELLASSGLSHLQALRYAEAEEVLAAAIALGLQDSEARYNLAFALFMQGRYLAALDVLSATKSLPFVLLLRARCLHHLGRFAEAVADCRACLTAQPEDADASGLLALLLYEQGQAGPARECVDAALKRSPRQLEALLTLASIQSQAQDCDRARDSFERLLDAYPQCGRGWLGLALIELSLMKIELARRHIERSAEHMPEHVGTWHVMGWIEILRGQVAAAEVAFNKALALDRNFGETHGGLAVVAALQGREDEARSGIRRALRLAPHALSPKYAEVVLLQRAGRHEEAAAVLDSVMARPLPSSDMQYRDLVTAQLRLLQTSAAGNAANTVYH